MRNVRRSLQLSAAALAAGLAVVPLAGTVQAAPTAPAGPAGATAVRVIADEVVTESAPAAASIGGASVLQRGAGLYGVRWNPCEPITYRINPRGGYPGSVRHIRQAFDQVGARTGVTFVYQGTTSRVALRDDAAEDWDVTVSWATAAQVPQLRGSVAGLASTTYVTHHDGTRENINGQIAFDRAAPLRRGYATSGRSTWGQVFLHETSHVMGLDHVAKPRLIMNPTITSENHTFAAGDLARLRRVGRSAGCIVSSAR